VLEGTGGLSDLATARANTLTAEPIPLSKLGTRVRWWVPLGVVVATFIVVSTYYNVRVPLYEAPDEFAHAEYVRIIADESRLPEFESIEEYEAWQPPLYYAVAAATLTVLGLDSPPRLEWNVNFPNERQNYVHTDNEDFPYNGAVLGAHVARGLNTLFGVGTVVLIYVTALLIFPQRRWLAFGASATVALVPQFAFISATISNDPASFFFAAAIVYLGLRSFRESSFWLVVLAGVAIALGALTKLSTLVVAVVPVAAVLLAATDWREKCARLAVLGLLPLAFAGWFFVRSLILWGTVFPSDLFWPLDPRPIWDPAYRQEFLEPVRQSFWYSGGPANIRTSPIIYDVLDVVSVLALAGIIVTFVSAQLTRFQKHALLALSILPVLALAMMLYHSVENDFLKQGRYLFVAMPAFAIMMPLGLSALFASDRGRDNAGVLVLPVMLLALNLSIFAITLPRYY
jgi:hypothetical protein